MARALQVWSPFREMERFRRDFDDLFNRLLGGGTLAPEQAFVPVSMPLESWMEGEQLVIRADLPGIDPDKVEVTVTGNTLTISGEREAHREEKKHDYMHREVSYGRFERSMMLPEGVKSDQIKASYNTGVLELRIPTPKELGARKVPIQIGDGGHRSEAKLESKGEKQESRK